jgi:sulfide:quinone oxidoreductase
MTSSTLSIIRRLLSNTTTSRKWISSSSSVDLPKYRIVVLGGGSAGMAVAAKLNRIHYDDYSTKMVSGGQIAPELFYTAPMALCEPSKTHYYQPLWTLVGGGEKPFEQSQKPQSELVDEFVKNGQLHWIQREVLKVNPEENTVELFDGLKVSRIN